MVCMYSALWLSGTEAVSAISSSHYNLRYLGSFVQLPLALFSPDDNTSNMCWGCSCMQGDTVSVSDGFSVSDMWKSVCAPFPLRVIPTEAL